LAVLAGWAAAAQPSRAGEPDPSCVAGVQVACPGRLFVLLQPFMPPFSASLADVQFFFVRVLLISNLTIHLTYITMPGSDAHLSAAHIMRIILMVSLASGLFFPVLIMYLFSLFFLA